MLDPNFVESYSDKHVLDGTYHKGMVHIWNGRELLHELLAKHSPTEPMSEEKRDALVNVLSLIIWGEYAAWQTSNALALEINEFGPKMAATSQAHDEARHYFTMCDYVRMVLEAPMDEIKITSTANAGLEAVVNANTLPKKLLGMQLMVEPVAITIFHALMKSEVEPILCELLHFYIKDEARHIALGVRQLPIEIEKMSWPQVLKLFAWQASILKREIDGLFELRDDLEILGIDYIDLFKEAERRQINAANEMTEHLNWNLPIEAVIKKVTTTYLKAKIARWV
jgi:hypothetical protein